MVVYCVEVYVKKGFEADFIKATEENHLKTAEEPGNVRFDVCKSADVEGLFFLYEVYENEAAVAAHKDTAHYLDWREKVEPWMDKKRYGRMFMPLFPADRSDW